MDLLKKIFIFVLFLFPLGEIIRINLGNGIVLKPIDVGVGCIVFLWLILKFKKREVIKQKYILTSVLFFTAIGGLSMVINSYYLSFNQFFESSMYLIRWAVYVGIFFMVSDFDRDFKKRIVNILLIVGSLIVGLGYLQYFFYSDAKSLLYLGWDEHMYRMFSTFLDPNFAGAFFVLFFLFVTNLFLKRKNILIGLLSILTLGAIFLTFSRSAFIMLILSSSLLLAFLNKKVWILLLLGIIIITLLISSRYFHIENINLFRAVSSGARLETAGNAIKIIQDKPIFGVGFNAYRYAQVRYGFRTEMNTIKSHADAGVDNSFLFILATGGVVGFVTYLFLWYKIFRRYLFSALVTSSILGLFSDSLFINSLFYPPIMMWMWILLGITEKK